MSNDNNKFSWSRFMTLLKGHFADQKSTIQWVVLMVFVLSLVLVVFFSLIMPSAPVDTPWGATIDKDALMVMTTVSYTSTVVGVIVFVVLSRVCANMESRSGDIAYLTLPATNLEKWLSRVVYVVIVGWVLVNAAYYLAILVCHGVGALLHIPSLNLLGAVFNGWGSAEHVFNYHFPATVHFFNHSFVFFACAAFLLGGTFFRRLGWLYTGLIMLLFLVLWSFGFGMAVGFLYQDEMVSLAKDMENGGNPLMILHLFGDVFTICGWLMVVLGVVMVWLSYHVFCRRQIEARHFKVIKR